MVMMPVYTRNFLSTYVQEHNVAAAHAMLRLQDLRNLVMNYKVARNQEAAMASIIPIDENNPCRHTLSDSPPREARRETRLEAEREGAALSDPRKRRMQCITLAYPFAL